MTPQKQPSDRQIWDRAVEVAKKEPAPEIKDDRPAIRAALRESRRRHTTKVKSLLP